ncbi:MAG: hypothetical protein D0433_11085 [Candidatus Thermochlorobacter aerophilum]|jgi:hypothetical protein|uniref:Uncharacterized protein n=1 Tax=Candidatus Thermochlorobacter aerophilus TaxID=1868324 RepID=A0A395LZN7_9BACT|nr:MAG: hypothetical protein D0433_11085 [Candidatus Thermochlorobacter aerophilum]
MAQLSTAQLDALNSVKYNLLSSVSDESVYSSILRKLNVKELKHLQEFFWDLLITESQQAQTKFTRADILAVLEPTSKYQQRARCQEPLGYCTISMCIRINPACATNRISGILLSIRPLLRTLVSERPDLLARFSPPSATTTSSLERQKLVKEGLPKRLAEPETLSDDFRAKFARHKATLWSMIESDGLDHALIMTEQGSIVQFATTKTHDLNRITDILADEIFWVKEQGQAAAFNTLLTVTKEFENGVLAIRSLGNKLYLVGSSQTVLPGKIHSLICRLGNALQKELQNAGA